MALTRQQKQKIIEGLKEKAGRQKVIIFVDFTGLKVKDFSNLRKKLKAAGNELKIAKKTLMGIAFKNKKLKMEPQKLKGEIALVFGYKDEISPAKIVWQFSQENPKLKILAGILENNFVEAERIIELAKLPAREELLARLVTTVSAPISNLVNVLQGNLRNFVYILSQINPAPNNC